MTGKIIPICKYCGKTIRFKSKRAINNFKQYSFKNYFCNKECYYKSMMNKIDGDYFCDYCGEKLVKDRSVFAKKKFQEKKTHFCNVYCQQAFISRKRKTSKEHKKIHWHKYNSIGWERQRFRGEILSQYDNCFICKDGGELQVHHIKPIKECPELAFEETNVIPLCIKCHKEIHYG